VDRDTHISHINDGLRTHSGDFILFSDLLLTFDLILVHFNQEEVFRVEQYMPNDHLLTEANDTEDGINRLIA